MKIYKDLNFLHIPKVFTHIKVEKISNIDKIKTSIDFSEKQEITKGKIIDIYTK